MSTTSIIDTEKTSTMTDRGPGTTPGASALRLLHVEDNPADALLMQEYIRGILPDVEFDTAERLADLTPERAIAAECAILDLSLPDASGLDALIALREMSADLPIIVLTGFEDLEVGLSALRYGADDYLVKNHVDGYTLERAVRYAVERRRLALDVVRETAATTVATAGAQKAEAALGAEILFGIESAGWRGARAASHAAIGTHQVAVRIEGETGDYGLVCETCDWSADRGDDDLHSWRDRSLDWVLMRHVAFGDIPGAAAFIPTPATRAAEVAGRPDASIEGDIDDGGPVARRTMLSPGRWLQPRTEAEPSVDGTGTPD